MHLSEHSGRGELPLPSFGCPGFTDGAAVKNLLEMQEPQETQVQFLGWKIPWRRKWQPTPVFLPGKKSPGQRSLEGYSPWVHKELDMTEQ